MYIDSTNETEPSGELPVAKLLQTNIEPLLKVKPCELHHDFSLNNVAINANTASTFYMQAEVQKEVLRLHLLQT